MAVARGGLLSYDVRIRYGRMLLRLPGSWVGSFGEKFREERERRGFTLDDVSNVTKIGSRMLQAIEQEHFDVLPGGVFNKGFIRAYAKVLGFNTEESITEYLAALHQAQLDAQDAEWDQALPPGTPSSRVAQAPPKAKVSEPKAKIAEPESPASRLAPADALPAPERAVPIPPSPRSLSPETPQPRPRLEESSVPPALVRPPATQLSSPPPLWISPSPTRPVPAKPSRVSVSVKPTSPPPSSSPDVLPEPPPARALDPDPQILAQEQTLSPPAAIAAIRDPQAKAAAATAPPARAAGQRWKIPGLILAVGVIVITALLWSRHPRPVAVPAKVDSTSSTQQGVATAGPALSNAGSAEAPSTTAVASTRTLKPSADSSGEQPSLPAAAKEPATTRRIPATAPAPFRVAIRASENCSITVTADGELVSREDLIAPANTSVKASREIVIRVSNAAGITFLWNDRPISAQGGEAEARTFVFDNAGLRTTPTETADPIR
jgi:cytoskeletal protein RodZ